MGEKGRLEKIVNILKNRDRPVKGKDLALLVKVSRQMIVKDIQELRRKGYVINSGPAGYSLSRSRSFKMVLSVKHGDHELFDELATIISAGGRVVDVIVIHPVYGELRGVLDLSDSDDLNRFTAALKSCEGTPLLNLSKDGVHLHTIEADSKETLERIKLELKNKGYLVI